jgi:hypothetical protein
MVGNKVVRPGHRALGQLRLVVEAAREDVAECRQFDYTDRHRLVRAQRHLLAALEIYVRALEAAGLEPHPQLRGEVDLLRAVTDASRQRSS